MSLAWTTIVSVVLLFPGILFFLGFYSGERLKRETIQPSVLSELAVVILVSFLVHALTVWGLTLRCGSVLPCVRLDIVFALLQIGGSDEISLRFLSHNLATNLPWVFAYFVITGGLGLVAGWRLNIWAEKSIGEGRFSRLVRHYWTHQLADRDKETITVAHVLTNIRRGDDRILIYRGFLYAYYFAKDGHIAYLVLKNSSRYYLCLDKDAVTTSPPDQWQAIGSVHGKIARGGDSKLSLLAIEGEDIANVVFDRVSLSSPPTPQLLERLKEEVEKELAESLQRLKLEVEKLRSQPSGVQNGISPADQTRDAGGGAP